MFTTTYSEIKVDLINCGCVIRDEINGFIDESLKNLFHYTIPVEYRSDSDNFDELQRKNYNAYHFFNKINIQDAKVLTHNTVTAFAIVKFAILFFGGFSLAGTATFVVLVALRAIISHDIDTQYNDLVSESEERTVRLTREGNIHARKSTVIPGGSPLLKIFKSCSSKSYKNDHQE